MTPVNKSWPPGNDTNDCDPPNVIGRFTRFAPAWFKIPELSVSALPNREKSDPTLVMVTPPSDSPEISFEFATRVPPVKMTLSPFTGVTSQLPVVFQKSSAPPPDHVRSAANTGPPARRR